MTPRRIGCSLLGCTLAAASLAGSLRAAESPVPAPKTAAVSESPGGRGVGLLPPLPYAPARVRSARTVTGTSARSRVGDADDEKQRVPKPPDDSRRKPEPGVTPQSDESSSDESSCVGSCIGSFFESMFTSDEPSPPPPPPSIAPTGMAWLPGAHGEIHWDAPVPVWDGPGGDRAGRNHVGLFPPRTRVMVLESNASLEGLWLRVRPMDGGAPVGWIESGYLGPFTQPPAPPDTTPLPPERFSAWLDVGWGLVGPADLNLEYADGGFRAEGQFLWTLAGPWQLGAGVGWRHFKGTPRVLYLTPSAVEEPVSSVLQTMDLGLRAGQRFGARSRGTRFTWLLGAGPVLVHEKADVILRSTVGGPEIGRREDSLSRWTWGGDLRLAVAWPANFCDFGLQVGGWIVDWQAEEKLSLTTDFLTEPIHGFDAALCVTFGGR